MKIMGSPARKSVLNEKGVSKVLQRIKACDHRWGGGRQMTAPD
jgi:hypothetical protein